MSDRDRSPGTYERVLATVLAVAGIAIAVALVHREFFVSANASARVASPDDPPTYEKRWTALISRGILIGRTDAPVKIVEFTDLECPFCRRFHGSLQRAMKRHGDGIAYVFIHYPLAGHQNALPAARAAECAYKQGSFAPFIDAVFERQESLGRTGWQEFAEAGGVPDLTSFAKCVSDTTTLARVEDGLVAGKEFQVTGTPTVIVNGWRFPTTPSDSQFDRVVSELVEGRTPFRR